MIAMKRSALLQKDLPDALSAALTQAGIVATDIWLCSDTDLNLSGAYQRVFLVATAEELVTVAETDGLNPEIIRKRFVRKEIHEIRTRQGVGGGFLEALVDGVCIEVVAYSNARADIFHKIAAKLRHWLKGQDAQVSELDDIDPRRCPKCGMTLQFKGDVCRRCVDRGAVLLRVLKLMRPYAGKAVVMMLLVLVGIGLAMIPQKLVQLLTDRVLAPEQAGNPDLSTGSYTISLLGLSMQMTLAKAWLLGLVGAYLATHLIGMTVSMIMLRLNSFVGTQITYDMRERVFSRLTQLSIDYYDRYNVGQLISRVSGDTEQMKGFINQITTGFLQQILMVIVVGVSLFMLNWKLALWTLVPAPLVVMGSIFFWKRVYPRYYRVWDSNSKLAGVLNTILSGIRVVKAFGQEPREQDRFGRSSSYVRDSFRDIEYTVAKFNPTIGLIFQLGGLIVWFVGGQMVLESKAMKAAGGHPELTLGVLLQFLGLLGMFYQPLTSLTQLTNWLTGFLTATQRTFEILDTPIQIAQAQAPVGVPEMKGSIVFENVTFGYDRHQPVLKGVSFSIAPGERIGIVGKSGSGKTTIINLLARFYDVDEGRVLIDGVDIRQMDTGDLRRQIGVVLQEPFLFRGTIYDNLTYGLRKATPDEVIAAAKAANCHDFIARHALGYDTYVGERGSGLSGGERQRISIARALLYNPRILVLDEATSSVDTESEKLIQDALKRITEGRTTIAIAHRLSTLKNSDRIFVVDTGKIAEMGTHEELMAAKGIYHNLVKIQTELSSEKSIDSLQAELPAKA
jgi:ATP-binding cassette subfamily B protein